jgi:hypothetical protein
MADDPLDELGDLLGDAKQTVDLLGDAAAQAPPAASAAILPQAAAATPLNAMQSLTLDDELPAAPAAAAVAPAALAESVSAQAVPPSEAQQQNEPDLAGGLGAP